MLQIEKYDYAIENMQILRACWYMTHKLISKYLCFAFSSTNVQSQFRVFADVDHVGVWINTSTNDY